MCTIYTYGQSFRINKYIIAGSINGHGAGRLTCRNGDAGAVGQGQYQVGFRCIIDRGGIGDLAAFIHFSRGGQGDRGGIYGVIDLSIDTIAEVQVFIVAALGIGDINREGFTVLINIIRRCINGHGAGGLTGRNGDAGAVGQGQYQVGFGGIIDRGGVVDLAAFIDLSRGGQGDCGGIYGVIDLGRGGVAGVQVFVIAALGVGDADREGFTVLIDIISRCINGHGAGGLTGRNGDAGAVGQGQYQVSFGGIIDRGGIGDLAAFIDLHRGSQGYRGGIYGVIDLSIDTIAEVQVFVVAALGLSDTDIQYFTVQVDIIAGGVDGNAA
ncbi:hypothetical protein SHAL103562_03145 [Shewanella algae]